MKKFTSSREYWEERYRAGRWSGAGSYGDLATFKAQVVNDFVAKHEINSVIDFGCGDGNQLKYLNVQCYLGVDVSEEAVRLARDKFHGHRGKRFTLLSDLNGEKADLTLSMDVIYHLVEDDVFCEYMDTLFSSGCQFVVIYSSNTEEIEDPNPHVRHRRFTDWIVANDVPFVMHQYIENPYHLRYMPNGAIRNEYSPSDFFIYRSIV